MATQATTAPRAVIISLGIDAAWTVAAPSGMALLRRVGSGTELLGDLPPSYDSFAGLAEGQAVSWHRPRGGTPDINHLLDAAKRLGGQPVDVVAMDMPLAVETITSRRDADRVVSRQFGAVGCGTHSPGAKRPGELGRRIAEDFSQAGYPLATGQADSHERCLLEVYPHLALLRMLKVNYRVPYKVNKTKAYWKSADKTERIHRLIAEWKRIVIAMDLTVPGTSSSDTRAKPSHHFGILKAV